MEAHLERIKSNVQLITPAARVQLLKVYSAD
jgi:hypothetical protein